MVRVLLFFARAKLSGERAFGKSQQRRANTQRSLRTMRFAVIAAPTMTKH